MTEKKLNQVDKLLIPRYDTFNQVYMVNDSIIIYSAMPMEFSIKK